MNVTSEQAAAAPTDLDLAVEQAIAARGGDARETVKAPLAANDFLGNEIAELRAAVSKGYSRGQHAAQRRKE